jgi:hypothetical protein
MPTTVTTETLTIRITISDDDSRRWGLRSFSNLLMDIESLLKAAAFLSADEAMRRNDQDTYYPSNLFALSEAERMPSNFNIGRLTYESPPDIHLVAAIASASATAISLAAWKVVDLWQKISEAREDHHRANTYESWEKLQQETMDMVRDEVQRVRAMRAEARPGEDLNEKSLNRLGDICNAAANALEKIETVVVEEG